MASIRLPSLNREGGEVFFRTLSALRQRTASPCSCLLYTSGIGVRQAGKGLSEVALGIAELLRKGLGLVFHFPSGNPAAGAESRMDGGAGLFIKLRPQREGDTFFKRQRFTDDAGGELEQPFVCLLYTSRCV